MSLLDVFDFPPRAPGVFWRYSPAFVQELANYLQGRRVLEVFAGNGFLAGHLALHGVAVTATTKFSGMDAHDRGLFHPVEGLPARSAVEKYGKTHDVLLVCWPTVTEDVIECVRYWGPGRDVVFIGEVTDYDKGHLGGCATDSFFEAVTFEHRFESYCGNLLEQAAIVRLRENQGNL